MNWVLPVWFKVLSLTAPPQEYAQRITASALGSRRVDARSWPSAFLCAIKAWRWVAVPVLDHQTLLSARGLLKRLPLDDIPDLIGKLAICLLRPSVSSVMGFLL
jgi:hypothetical protein